MCHIPLTRNVESKPRTNETSRRSQYPHKSPSPISSRNVLHSIKFFIRVVARAWELVIGCPSTAWWWPIFLLRASNRLLTVDESLLARIPNTTSNPRRSARSHACRHTQAEAHAIPQPDMKPTKNPSWTPPKAIQDQPQDQKSYAKKNKNSYTLKS